MRIKTPSRLHLGFIDPLGKLGRIYGSIGVAIEEPSWLLEFERSDRLTIESEDAEALDRIIKVIERLESFIGRKVYLNIKVLSSIPFHVGLGAGTQLSLAVSEAVLRLEGISYSKEDLIKLSGRGRRSGIGISVYFDGGFILDVGKKNESDIPPLTLLHLKFPPEWLFLVVLPSLDLRVHDRIEEEKFKVLRDLNVYEISYLILMGLLPSLIERDIGLFGRYLTLIQRKVGEIFYDSQGGVFAHELCERLIDFMLEEGAYGAGQSSWGPVVYGLVKKGEEAEVLKRKVEEFILSMGFNGKAWLTGVNSLGREIF